MAQDGASFPVVCEIEIEGSRCKLDPAFEASFGGCSFPLLRLVVLVNGLGIGFLVVTRILISDLNQLSAECKISLLSGNVSSVCCPDAGVGKGVLDVFGLSGAGFVRFWTGLICSSFGFWCPFGSRFENPLRFQLLWTSISNEVPVLNLLPALFSSYLRM